MDDANVPSLLSAPYLGYVAKTDPTYLATRKAVLDPAVNPYFFHGSFEGQALNGTGGPHVGPRSPDG